MVKEDCRMISALVFQLSPPILSVRLLLMQHNKGKGLSLQFKPQLHQEPISIHPYYSLPFQQT